MADADKLDSLSNAELRAQMLAQGLPNIPVTDSSRKVLVKRLRASLGGNANLPAATASPKKTSTRRDTLQPAVAAAQVDKPDGTQAATKARRTIAYTPSDTKEAERRRQPVNKPETVPEAVAVAKPVAAVATKAAPIQSRRISNSERREQIPERVIRKPETIAEEPTVPKKRNNENTLMVNSLIILESDEEEDEQLAQAARNAEDQYTHNKQQAAQQLKLSATTINTHDYVPKPLYPSLQPTQEQQRPRQIYEHAPSTSQPRTTLGSSSLDYRVATGRYSSYASPLAQGYITGASRAAAAVATAAPLGAAGFRRSPPRTFSNEFSDDTAEEEEDSTQGVRFESDFARNLARLRAERIGDRSSSYRSTVAGGSITGGRRSLRPEHNSSSAAFMRLWQSLDHKYKLTSKLFVLIVGLLLYGVYRFFY
ncbi:otefin [Drosophila montana]|uniref:otefin n=1 Tax=Drosophila montana TaxID=40370 RepID=UPI00313EF2D6